MIQINFYGNLKDELATTQTSLEWFQGVTSLDIIELLKKRSPLWEQALAADKIYKIAINDTIVHHATTVNDGDIIAILPPVTGG